MMDVQQAIADIRSIQGAMHVLTMLQLTAYRFPPSATVTDGDSLDFIVVGAGSAGCVIANRLTEDPNVTVLLIEAGGDPPIESVLPGLVPFMQGSQVDWNHTIINDGYSTQCHVNKVYKATHAKMLGGTSSMNSMMYVRGDPTDFDDWANITNDTTWSYKNIFPYYIKSERLEDDKILHSNTRSLHGTDGYLGVTKDRNKESIPYLEAFQEIGRKLVEDVNGYDKLAFGEVMYTKSHGERQSTAQSFLSTILSRPNLYVLKHALVTKLLFDDHKNVIGVQITDKNDTNFNVMANVEVIVSAGAINSPQLLMLSGIGPKKHLQSLNIPVISDVPVGLNLQDHLGVIFVHIMDKVNITSLPRNPHKPIPVINGFVSIDKSHKNPRRDYQSTAVLFDAENIIGFCGHLISLNYDICQQIYDEGRGKQIVLTNVNIMQPKSRGIITLPNNDPKQAPVIDLKAFSNRADLENIIKYAKDFLRIENSTYFKTAGARRFRPNCIKNLRVGSKNYWRQYCLCMSITFYHYAGTCAMGSVLDSRLRVLGVGKLRVVDAGVMPTISSANPNPTVIMIAEKAADMIKEDNYKRFAAIRSKI